MDFLKTFATVQYCSEAEVNKNGPPKLLKTRKAKTIVALSELFDGSEPLAEMQTALEEVLTCVESMLACAKAEIGNGLTQKPSEKDLLGALDAIALSLAG